MAGYTSKQTRCYTVHLHISYTICNTLSTLWSMRRAWGMRTPQGLGVPTSPLALGQLAGMGVGTLLSATPIRYTGVTVTEGMEVPHMQKQRLLKLLQDARDTATMKQCGMRDVKIEPREPFYPEGMTIGEVTRLWRETWIIAPLDEAIRLLKASK